MRQAESFTGSIWSYWAMQDEGWHVKVLQILRSWLKTHVYGFFLKIQLALVGLTNRERAAIEVAKRHQLLLESPAGEA
jgi:hypothetical protein